MKEKMSPYERRITLVMSVIGFLLGCAFFFRDPSRLARTGEVAVFGCLISAIIFFFALRGEARSWIVSWNIFFIPRVSTIAVINLVVYLVLLIVT